eukprot:scaffold13803_cov51-Cyclotella_meneghiniana.AAC.8
MMANGEGWRRRYSSTPGGQSAVLPGVSSERVRTTSQKIMPRKTNDVVLIIFVLFLFSPTMIFLFTRETAVIGTALEKFSSRDSSSETTSRNKPNYSTELLDSLKYIRRSVSDVSNPATTCPYPWDDEAYQYMMRSFPVRTSFITNTMVGIPLGVVGYTHTKHKYTRFTHPMRWECRLKERLHTTIVDGGLSKCAFGFLDIGTALGDWVIALSGFQHARFAAVEAHPRTFLEMLRALKVNRLLDEVGQVSAYPAAVGDSNNIVMMSQKYNETRVSWPNSEFIKVSSWPGSTLCMPNPEGDNNGQFQAMKLSDNNDNNECKGAEVAVPIVSIDMIMHDWQINGGGAHPQSYPKTLTKSYDEHAQNYIGQLAYGGLFAAKVDIEGAERDAIKSATLTFMDPHQRPCQLYFELKHGDEYAEALEMLVSFGYTEYIDVDSGLAGVGSFPPVGKLWPNEGNYEFRLSTEEFQKCVARVQRATCTKIM